jgi:hypothetical protein
VEREWQCLWGGAMGQALGSSGEDWLWLWLWTRAIVERVGCDMIGVCDMLDNHA